MCSVGTYNLLLHDLSSTLPASPNPTHSEQRKGLKNSVLHSWRLMQLPVLEVASSPSPSLKCSILTILGTNPACGRHVITPRLQLIKSPYFCLWVQALQPQPLWLENIHGSCFAQINLVLYFFSLAWSGLLCWQRNLLWGQGQNTYQYALSFPIYR